MKLHRISMKARKHVYDLPSTLLFVVARNWAKRLWFDMAERSNTATALIYWVILGNWVEYFWLDLSLTAVACRVLVKVKEGQCPNWWRAGAAGSDAGSTLPRIMISESPLSSIPFLQKWCRARCRARPDRMTRRAELILSCYRVIRMQAKQQK